MKYCEAYAALLDSYIDGELSGEEAARVRAHLAACPGCGAYVEDALAIRAAFPDAEDVELPENFTGSVMAAVRGLEAAPEAEDRHPRRKAAHWKKVLLPLAACFAIVFIVRGLPVRGGSSGAAANTTASDNSASDNGASAAPAAIEGGEVWKSAVQDVTAAGPSADADVEDGVPADMPMGGAEPAAAAPAVTENGQTRYVGLEGTKVSPSAVRLTSAQAGDLLEGVSYTVTGDERCYRLTAAEFDALLAALEEQGVMPEREETPEETAEDGYLVYVTEN